jgi:hypothetical protein
MSAHLATPSNDRGDLISEPPATHGHEWLCCERCLVCHRLASLIVKASNLSRADSHGSSVGPVNHVLRGDTWSHSPESLAIASSCLGEVSNAPQDHSATGSRAAQRAEWSCSGRCHAPLFPPAIFQWFPLVLPRACPCPFSMRANPDRLLLLLWRLHCLKKC